MENTRKYRLIAEKNRLFTFIWMFLIVELTVFLGVAYFFFIPQDTKESTASSNDFYTIVLYISYLVVTAVIPLAYKIYEIKKKQAQRAEFLKQKIDIYFFNLIINYSLYEFSGALILLAVYLNKMTEPLYMFGIIFIALILNKPSLKNFIQPKKEYENSHVIITEKEPKISDSEGTKNKTL